MAKERYFLPETIEQKARSMIRDAGADRLRRDQHFSPRRSALLVLDMQSYFLNDSSHAYIPSAEAIVPGILELTREYSAWDLPIYYTQHLNTLEDAGMMAAWWRDLITPEHEFNQVISEFDLENGILIKKSQYDAFYQTDLEERLHNQNVSQLVVCGVMTHLCVETTIRSAFVRGFEVFFPVDGTATYNEEFHLATLRNLSHGFAVPVLTKDILAQVRTRDED